jgi:hypothetical protein
MGPVQAQHEEWVTKEKQDAVAEAVKALDAQLYEANNECRCLQPGKQDPNWQKRF